MMRQGSPLRLRSVRYKDGRGDLRVIHTRTVADDRADVEYFVRRVLDVHAQRIAGYAIVVWAPDQSSTADLGGLPGNTVPTIMIPDFVRNRLLAEKIEMWTVKGLEERGKI